MYLVNGVYTLILLQGSRAVANTKGANMGNIGVVTEGTTLLIIAQVSNGLK